MILDRHGTGASRGVCRLQQRRQATKSTAKQVRQLGGFPPIASTLPASLGLYDYVKQKATLSTLRVILAGNRVNKEASSQKG